MWGLNKLALRILILTSVIILGKRVPTSSCQTSEAGVEYQGAPGEGETIVWNVTSVKLCQTECESLPECKVWTFVGSALSCFLKSSRVKDVPSSEAISGECTHRVNIQGLELRGGLSGEHEGNIFLDGRPVCDDGFSQRGHENAIVVCRMLGYQSGTFTENSHFGNVPLDFIMDDVHCNGTEKNLRDCSHNSKSKCTEEEGAGVICSELALVGGSGPHEGKIYFDGMPVCQNVHSKEEDGNALVICRMLGYTDGNLIGNSFGKVAKLPKEKKVAKLPKENNTFVLDELRCKGSELDIRMCPHSKRKNCEAGEGAGVICSNSSVVTRSDGDFKSSFMGALSSVHIIIGCIAIVFVAIAIVICCCCWRRRRILKEGQVGRMESSRFEYWTTTDTSHIADTSDTAECVPQAVMNQRRGSVDSNGYWQPYDTMSMRVK